MYKKTDSFITVLYLNTVSVQTHTHTQTHTNTHAHQVT